jgi:hypothetical protein
METQLPGFAMMHVVSDRDALVRWVPKLAYMLASRAVLIVLDNLESLLTAALQMGERITQENARGATRAALDECSACASSPGLAAIDRLHR